jgi:hypothetical protein
MNTTEAPGTRRAAPLSDGELAAAKTVAVLVAALGVLGFVNSFRAVARAAVSSFGELAPTVPLGIDLAIAVFSALDLVLARLDMRPRWVRLIPQSLTGATIYLNVAGQASWFGRVAHAVFPALWVMAVQLAAHVIRIRAQLASGTQMDPIRASRWLLAPVSTARMARRMVLWEIRSYPEALGRERARLLALTGLQDAYGVLAWRWKAPRRIRALYRLGELAPAGTIPAQDDVTPDATPAGSDSHGEHDNPGVAMRLAAVRAARTGIPRAAPGWAATGSVRPDERTDPPPAVDRDAVVAALAEQIREAIEAGERWRPDYQALMQATGYRRSWCEKAVRDARMAVLDPPPGNRTGPGHTGDAPADSRTDDRPALAAANGHVT